MIQISEIFPYLPYNLNVKTGDGIGRIVGFPNFGMGSNVVSVHFGTNLKKKQFDIGVGNEPYHRPSNCAYYYLNKTVLQNVIDKNDILDLSENTAYPILRPFTPEELTKEITTYKFLSEVGKQIEKKKTFIPVYELAEVFLGTYLKQPNSFDIRSNYIQVKSGYNDGKNSDEQSCKISLNPERIQWWEMEKFLEWHFDIFYLIDKGLAIDINNLTF